MIRSLIGLSLVALCLAGCGDSTSFADDDPSGFKACSDWMAAKSKGDSTSVLGGLLGTEDARRSTTKAIRESVQNVGEADDSGQIGMIDVEKFERACKANGDFEFKKAANAITASPSATAASTFDIHGSLTVKAGQMKPVAAEYGGGCEGVGPVEDIYDGSPISVYDPDGAVVGSGQLGGSRVEGGSCVFDVEVTDVKQGGTTFKIRVGDQEPVAFDDSSSTDLQLTIG